MDAGTARLRRSLLQVPRARNPSGKTWMWIGAGALALVGLGATYRLKSKAVKAVVPPPPGWTRRWGTLQDEDGITQDWATGYWSEEKERARDAQRQAEGPDSNLAPYDADRVGWSWTHSNRSPDGVPGWVSTNRSTDAYPTEQAAIDALKAQSWHTDFHEFS